ncbi:MAG: radical SAM family heme chaperone HemW [Anaerolineae bacterium]|nr:MAG: radical SAM family heme chaperone HemW [Anaerolineae bacterium]
MDTSYSLYLHIPFCRHRCAYCDFNTYAGLEALIPAYAQALCREMAFLRQAAGERPPIHTLFLGGGTPSLLPITALETILQAAHTHFSWHAPLEITLEANPGTLDRDYLRAAYAVGVNRLSLGMQSAQPEELRFLERQHDFGDVIQAVEWARRAGFENLSLDLIYGLPEQSLARWEQSLSRALDLQPEHISLYALTLEHGTPLSHWVDRGLVPLPDADRAAEMYELACERLDKAGFEQYEISNWARPGHACRHNLQYWRNLPYLGLGAGAHGFAAGYRTVAVRASTAYIERLQNAGAPSVFPRTPATAEAIPVDRATEMSETLIMGLRLTQEGVSLQRFEQRFGQRLEEHYSAPIRRLRRAGLLEWHAEALRLTPRGRLLGNRVFMEFV